LDALDRLTNSVDANSVTVVSTFDDLNRVQNRIYPDTGVERFGYTFNIAGATAYTNQLGKVTRYGYDALGRKIATTNANLEVTQFGYAPAGDLLTLTDGKSQVTTWIYDQYGRVTNKLDAANNLIFFYQYDSNSRLTSRWTPAKGTTSYRYDAVGNLTNIAYPSGPNISMAYDVQNRLTNMVDAVGTTRYTYNTVGQLLSEDGPWADDTVSYAYANRLRASMSLLQPNASPWVQTYAWDAARRLTNTASPAGAFGYAYDPQGAMLVKNLSLPNGASITNSYDGNARLLATVLINSGGAVLNSHNYGYNLGNQRTQEVFTAGNYVNYSYDDIGQLIGAAGKEAGGGTSRLHEQFGYTYDAAGNLSNRVQNLLTNSFSVNNLNELTMETNSGTLTVAGTTTSAATTVTVNGANADLYYDATFARTNVSLLNGLNTFTAIAHDAYGRSDTNVSAAYFPVTNLFVYDLNGNLRTNGNQVLEYDDENQLISITVSNAWRSEFAYDGKLRRRKRKEFTWTGSWTQTNEVRYVYDGNLVIQERDANNLPSATYTRAKDLSGSLQSAGGIGGLLARSDNLLSPLSHAFYHADGNGNITLISANQLVVGRYVYDPFGNILSMSGPVAEINLYRFSSKEAHPNSGLIYYLYRYYSPGCQRWLNRDPLADLCNGAFAPPSRSRLSPAYGRAMLIRSQVIGNSFMFDGNDPQGFYDAFGLKEVSGWQKWGWRLGCALGAAAACSPSLAIPVVGEAAYAACVTYFYDFCIEHPPDDNCPSPPPPPPPPPSAPPKTSPPPRPIQPVPPPNVA
jgi:RHS repeat-associated protein